MEERRKRNRKGEKGGKKKRRKEELEGRQEGKQLMGGILRLILNLYPDPPNIFGACF